MLVRPLPYPIAIEADCAEMIATLAASLIRAESGLGGGAAYVAELLASD